MNINDYRKQCEIILSELPSNSAYQKYKRLTEIFIMDCALDVHEVYWGNTVKQKSKLLFKLQEHFLNFKEI